MATFSEAIAGAIKATLCTILAGSDSVTQFSNSIVGLPAERGNIARALRRQICNNNDNGISESVLPFSGGQCSFRYNTVGYFRAFNNSSTTRNWNGAGNVSANSSRLFGPYTTTGVFGPITMVPRSGGFAGTYAAAQGGAGGAVDGSGGLGWAYGPTKTENLTVTPQSSSDLDTCGDPTPIGTPTPYVPTAITQNITYDNSTTTINESVKVTIFAPVVAIGGVIYAPVTVNGPLFTLEGTLEISPNFEVNLRPKTTKGPGSGPDSEPPNPDQPTGEPTDEPTNRVITGVIVTVTDAIGKKATRITQDRNPDIWAPRLGNVAFYVKSGTATAWTEDFPVKTTRQWIPCPVPQGAVDVRGTPDPGYAFTLSPVWEVPLIPRM